MTSTPTTSVPDSSMKSLRSKLSRVVEHDEFGKFGERCDGQYECVCDDDFTPYPILTDELSLKDVLQLIESYGNHRELEGLNKADETIGIMMREYANLPLDGRPNAFNYLYKVRLRIQSQKENPDV